MELTYGSSFLALGFLLFGVRVVFLAHLAFLSFVDKVALWAVAKDPAHFAHAVTIRREGKF